MNKNDQINRNATTEDDSIDETNPSCSKTKNRGRKRKRHDSETDSEFEDILPDNALEVEKNLQASAIKNNLDDISVKKILKKVVTNDHVLALVKLREEEENSKNKEKNPQPNPLTRAKAKELMRISPKSAPWNLELTPIKHIPVKTRPEVEALISKELPDDEDDDEYEPTHDDVPSDDEHTLESCSDLDSQPATPAAPARLASPLVVKDGPFKVPPVGLSTPVRRKLPMEEEEATIALRTRSKINLSATPIEHIESSFVPPDDVPTPIGDDLWNQFLEECLNPGEVSSRHEEDDDADPEYNVAADPDAHDEDEEALENTIIKISKKELNDLVTELFSIMPEDTQLDAIATDTQLTSQFEGKQEPKSDEEHHNTDVNAKAESISHRSSIRFSIGKSEIGDENFREASQASERDSTVQEDGGNSSTQPNVVSRRGSVSISVEERGAGEGGGEGGGGEGQPPPSLRARRRPPPAVHVTLDPTVEVVPSQVLVLQQQLRQHVQLAASNFLQLFVNPAHWNLAPIYKEYLEQLNKMVDSNPNSVANVCNLKPALELVKSWEDSVSEDNPENKKMVEFIQNEAEKGRRRFHQNSMYAGNFPDMFLKVVANSPVFLYPYLLPPMPYRADSNRKFGYLTSEDELIAIGLDQFWQYVEDNPDIFKRKNNSSPAKRWGLTYTCTLVSKYMFPWISPKLLMCHISKARKLKDNPIQKFFKNREVVPVKHKLLPFNPKMILYEQPEHEMPKIWIRYLARTSHRFRRDFYSSRHRNVREPEGVPVNSDIQLPTKNPLPIEFRQEITRNRLHDYKNDRQISQQNTTVIGILSPIPTVVQKTLNSDNVPNVSTNVGPVLTINPLGCTNINALISKNNLNKQGETSVKEKVAISANPRNSIEMNKTDAPNKNLIGKLIPVCVSKLTDPKTTTTNVNSVGSSTSDSQDSQTTQANTKLVVVPNMYKVVKTNLGAYLMPISVIPNTKTVNSINAPIISTKDTSVVGNDLPQESSHYDMPEVLIHKDEESRTHCRCCVILRKICKKQTHITDFFKPKNDIAKKCECSNRKYPSITKRLRFLVKNHKSRSWWEQRRVQKLLESTPEVRENKKEYFDEEFTEEDIVYATTFQMKIMHRSVIAKSIYLKKRINTALSKFDPDSGSPISLAKELYDVFGVELVDLHKEFLGFLTAKQADKIGEFKDYFVNYGIHKLVDKIEEEIKEEGKRKALLAHVNKIFTDIASTPCEMCSGILAKLTEYPSLAQFVFSLFPHLVNETIVDRCEVREKRKPPPNKSDTPSKRLEEEPIETAKPWDQEQSAVNPAEATNEDQETGDHEPEGSLTICDESTLVGDYEADHSSSDEDYKNAEELQISHDPKEQDETSNLETTMDTTTSKTEFPEYAESTDMSPLVMSEDEQVKTESSEWKREEDKAILQVLLQYLTPQERKDKTILEILDEKNVYSMITKELSHKSFIDVKNRVMYLLEILVQSE